MSKIQEVLKNLCAVVVFLCIHYPFNVMIVHLILTICFVKSVLLGQNIKVRNIFKIKDHKFVMRHNIGGCCDCGDEQTINKLGFCSNHNGFDGID